MLPITDSFEFDHDGSDVLYGRGRVDGLGDHLGELGLNDALIVCGSNVGANEDLMDPIEEGLGDVLAAVFDGTTPDKRIETVFDGIDAMNESGADVLVGVGGGSSLDIARQMSVFAADGRSLDEFREDAREGRDLSRGDSEPAIPVVVIPTTFAGADISSGGSVEVLSADEAPGDHPVRVSGSAMPVAMLYDPSLFETSPESVLAGSAMNGFDKGIETLYARDASPDTDATAIHGTRLLREAYPDLPDPDAMDRAVVGMILVQLHRKISIVHAFGHGFARHYPVQQGLVHGVMVPHVLRYLLGEVDVRREALAAALDVETDSRSDEEIAEGIVDAVVAVRDSFDLPTRLRELDPIEQGEFPRVAEFIRDDYLMPNAPAALDPDADEIEAVLHEAW